VQSATGLRLRNARTTIKMVDWDWDKKEEEDNYDGPGSERGQVRPPRPVFLSLLSSSLLSSGLCNQAPPLQCLCVVQRQFTLCNAGLPVSCSQINRSDQVGAASLERLAKAKAEAEAKGRKERTEAERSASDYLFCEDV
jgi:hypothetical protein